MPPEPYQSAAQSSILVNASPTALPGGEESDNFNGNLNANGETNEVAFEEAESQSLSQQPTKVRPPAKFFLGKPHKVNNNSSK